MKPFNLDKALAGAPVVRRDGVEVTQLHLFHGYMVHPLAGIVENRAVMRWDVDGKYEISTEVHHADLFMKSTVQKGWIVLYKPRVGPIDYNAANLVVNDIIYTSEEMAKQKHPYATAIVPVEWEE